MPPDEPMPAARSPPVVDSRLWRLPNELQDMILAEVDDSQSLLNVSLTCKHLKAMAEPHLYRDVFIVDKTGLQSFSCAIVAEPLRAISVRQLSIDVRRNDKRDKDRALGIMVQGLTSWVLLFLLDTLENLENLYVKSPNMDWDFYKILRQASRGEILCSLQTCEIFPAGYGLHGHSEWQQPAEIFQPLLLHPTLEELTLINVTGTPGPLLYCQPFTSLQKLEILSSGITLQGIKDALSYSTCLKELVVYPDTHFITQEQWDSAPDFSAEVFASVKDTLLKLVIYTGIPGTSRAPMELHTLTALRHLAVDDYCLFGRAIEDAGREPFSLVQLKTIFPPNMEIWEVHSVPGTVMKTIDPILAHKDELCPRLKRISIDEVLNDEVSRDDVERFSSAGIALTFDFRFLFLDWGRKEDRYDNPDDRSDESDRNIVICSEGLSLPISYID